MVFSPAFPYSPHIRPHHIHQENKMRVDVSFRFVQIAQFFFFAFLLFIIYLKISSMLIS